MCKKACKDGDWRSRKSFRSHLFLRLFYLSRGLLFRRSKDSRENTCFASAAEEGSPISRTLFSFPFTPATLARCFWLNFFTLGTLAQCLFFASITLATCLFSFLHWQDWQHAFFSSSSNRHHWQHWQCASQLRIWVLIYSITLTCFLAGCTKQLTSSLLDQNSNFGIRIVY